MVIIHIANIDVSVIGGVQVAVPQMIKAQSQFASVGFINTHGDVIDGVQMLEFNRTFELEQFPAPFNNPDIIVFHEVYRFEYIKIYKAIQKTKIPYIILPHGCLSKQAQKRKFLKKFTGNVLFFNGFIKSAQALQYLSDNEARMSVFSVYPSFISGNGIAIPEKKKNSFFINGVKIVYIGRLEILTKGLDLLIEAIKKIAPLLRQNNARVEIYGPDYDGAHELLRKTITKFNISDLISVNKEIMGMEKESVLLSADCFIQTSRTEGLPMGPLEALGYGLPCIVTDGVGLGELIESFGAGYCCETSVDGIADAIKRFIVEREKVASMSNAAVDMIATKFDRNLIAKKTVSEYSQIKNSEWLVKG